MESRHHRTVTLQDFPPGHGKRIWRQRPPGGHKLKLAVMTGRFKGIGEDLVNACVNDVIVCGAKPILFLTYINMSVLRSDVATSLVETLSDAHLRLHPPYFNRLARVFGMVKCIAHITGGGLIENVPGILPEGVAARFDTSA